MDYYDICSLKYFLRLIFFKKNVLSFDFNNLEQKISLQYFQRHTKLADTSRKLKSQIWSSVVTIVLVEAKGILPDSENATTESYAKFRLGNEKYKSKVSWRSKWLEQFDLHLFDEDQILEVSIWNRNTMYGKCSIDLRSLPRESTHGIWQVN